LKPAAVLLLFSTSVCAEELVDDFSRGDLLRYAMGAESSGRAVPDKFIFPTDAVNRTEWLFGTDVSHHDGTVDWTKARKQEVRFAYVKATQGLSLDDGMFAKNWEGIAKVWGDESTRVYRGAYHFLSAQGDAKVQAEHFLSKVGTMLPTDLPPTMDLEWDAPPGSKDPGAADRWKALSSAEILEKVQTWLEIVEKATGKTPIVYTAASWWNDRIGKTDKLSKYRIWIADYSAKSQLNETPRLPSGYAAHIWQFSERGRVREGFTTNVDVNVFKGTFDQFLEAHNVPKQ
jgi:lysozyme